MNAAMRFLREESAVSTAEYALLGALIAMVCVTAVGAVGAQVNVMFANLGLELTTAGM